LCPSRITLVWIKADLGWPKLTSESIRHGLKNQDKSVWIEGHVELTKDKG